MVGPCVGLLNFAEALSNQLTNFLKFPMLPKLVEGNITDKGRYFMAGRQGLP